MEVKPFIGKSFAVIIKDREVLSVGGDYESVTKTAFLELNCDGHVSMHDFDDYLNEFRSGMLSGYDVVPDQLSIVELSCCSSIAFKVKDYVELMEFAIDRHAHEALTAWL